MYCFWKLGYSSDLAVVSHGGITYASLVPMLHITGDPSDLQPSHSANPAPEAQQPTEILVHIGVQRVWGVVCLLAYTTLGFDDHLCEIVQIEC